MPDYQKMYTTLFNTVSDVIEQLQDVQQKTEQLYINTHTDLQLFIPPQREQP